MLPFLFSTACAPPESGECALSDAPQLLVVRALHIAVAEETGVSEGFDQDGAVSTENGPTGCGIADYTSPSGEPGIDNAFSRLVPALNATEARLSTIESLVQASIDSGELLIAIEVGGVESWESDECVAVELGQADAGGALMLGTDGFLLDGQTFARDDDAPTDRLEGAAIKDGTLSASGLSINLPVQILDVALELPVRDGLLVLTPTGDDAYEGLLAGAISADFILEVASGGGIDDTVGDLMSTLLVTNADLPDESGSACKAVSMTIGFEAVGGYYFE